MQRSKSYAITKGKSSNSFDLIPTMVLPSNQKNKIGVFHSPSFDSSNLIGKAPMTRGSLIVFEGRDKSGKTTHSLLLKDYLTSQGNKVILLQFPDISTTYGRDIQRFIKNEIQLTHQESYRLFSENLWESKSLVQKKIQEGFIVIYDRYIFSSIVYHLCLKNPLVTFEECMRIDGDLNKPDLVILLNIDQEISETRGGKEILMGNDYKKKGIDLKKNISEKYEALFDFSWVNIDASQPIDSVQKNIEPIADKCIITSRKRKLARLWGYK